MTRRSLARNALGAVLGLVFLPWVMAQEATPGRDLPSAESIMDRYVEVTGGAAAYESRTSEVAAGTFEIPAVGITGQLQISTKPGLQRQRVELPGVGLIESGVKDGVAWETNPITGPRILEGAAARLAIMGAQPGAQARWREWGCETAEATGSEDVNGEPAYRVVGTCAGMSFTSHYSVDSGLLLKNQFAMPTPLGEIPVEQSFEDYAETEGILGARRIVTTNAGQRIVITFTSGEVNVEIPDERFALPEAVQALVK